MRVRRRPRLPRRSGDSGRPVWLAARTRCTGLRAVRMTPIVRPPAQNVATELPHVSRANATTAKSPRVFIDVAPWYHAPFPERAQGSNPNRSVTPLRSELAGKGRPTLRCGSGSCLTVVTGSSRSRCCGGACYCRDRLRAEATRLRLGVVLVCSLVVVTACSGPSAQAVPTPAGGALLGVLPHLSDRPSPTPSASAHALATARATARPTATAKPRPRRRNHPPRPARGLWWAAVRFFQPTIHGTRTSRTRRSIRCRQPTLLPSTRPSNSCIPISDRIPRTASRIPLFRHRRSSCRSPSTRMATRAIPGRTRCR